MRIHLIWLALPILMFIAAFFISIKRLRPFTASMILVSFSFIVFAQSIVTVINFDIIDYYKLKVAEAENKSQICRIETVDFRLDPKHDIDRDKLSNFEPVKELITKLTDKSASEFAGMLICDKE